MFGMVNPTPYDLRFWIANIPVRVHPLFWLVSLILGWNLGQGGRYDIVLLWVLCVFVSILVHELGHAVVARHYGYRPEIVLHSFGGYAAYIPTHWCGTAASVLISFAGPAAGFLFYGAISFLLTPRMIEFLVRHAPQQAAEMFLYSLAFLKHINLWWGLVNLLPVLPLDGGRISSTLLGHFLLRNGQEWAYRLSLVAAFLVAYYAFQSGQSYVALMFAYLGVQSLQALQAFR